MSEREETDAKDEVEEEEDEPAIPENVPDDWLDQKPFDPAGR